MQREPKKLAQHSFDLLVCGGGIYGAWTAYDAALRGLKVALVEQADWASATSSASSKLIHGGLRYLETYDFKLVKKALAERQMLLTCAPHRVWPLRFGVPIYRDSRVGKLRMKAGLMLYDALANFPDKNLAHHAYNRAEFSAHFSWLKDENLSGGFTYGDAQTDDARLVLELIYGAQQHGAVCVNYCRLNDITEEQNIACGALVQDQISGEKITVRARQIVNTTGQWISTDKAGKTWCRMSKGIHLVLPGGMTDEAMLLIAPQDGRVFFIIPWYGMTLLGTTDEDYQGDVNQVRVAPAEVEYLLTAANHYLQRKWTAADIVASYAGVRVMQRGDADSPSQLSRDWILRTTENGVHFSVGGKITSARVDAANIVDTVCKKLAVTAACATHGKAFPWTPDGDYQTWCEQILQRAASLNVDADCALWLVRRHGKSAQPILDSIATDATLAQRIVASVPFIFADLCWCAQHEMVTHLDDLLRRRVPLLILAQLNHDTLKNLAEKIAVVLNWDDETMRQEIQTCENF